MLAKLLSLPTKFIYLFIDRSTCTARNQAFVFRSDMIVRSIGNSLMVILPDLVGKKITHFFDLVRPLIAFKFHSVRIFLETVLFLSPLCSFCTVLFPIP